MSAVYVTSTKLFFIFEQIIAMRKHLIWILLISLSFTSQLNAQKQFTISGYVKDSKSGEDFFAANVYIKELLKGTTTNVYGFYSLSTDPGIYTVVFSYIGTEDVERVITLDKDTTLNIELSENEIVTDEVTVTGRKEDKNVDDAQTSVIELDMKTVKELPALLGEADIFRTLQLKPGVASAGEGNSGLYVRGGGPAQNLVLLDNATVYNPGHLLGFFSVFNADAIKSSTLIKGGIPAEYGGRISSVLDITMREGNMKEYEFEGGIGFISSRLTAQGPIIKDKAAFIVSGRFTYLSFLLNPILKKQDNPIAIPWFFDINAKMNFKLGEKDRLFVSAYFGRDKFSFSSGGDGLSFELPYGNATTSVRWNHQFNGKVFMNNTFVFNDYTSKIKAGFGNNSFQLNSGIRDYGLKGAIEFFPKITNKFKAGYEYIFHQFTPYVFEANLEDTEFTSDIDVKYGHEFALFIQDEIDVTTWLKINVGLRGSMYASTGPNDRVYFDGAIPIDTVSKGVFQSYATYFGGEPRINARFKIDDQTSVKVGANLNYQYIHSVSQSTTTLPTDLWVSSTDIVKPEIGSQVSLGVFRNFKDNMYETSIEGYYKKMWNQVEYGNEPVVSANEEIEDQFVFGEGEAYGTEFYVAKVKGKITGWVGYTLAWTNRSFPDIDNGKTFFNKYDRRHDLSVVFQYNINKRWNLNATFVYGSGQTTTPVINRYVIAGEIVNEYGDRNSLRLPAYHRLDVGASFIMKDDDKLYSDLNFSVYNLYSRQNPYFIFDDINFSDNRDITIQARQVSLFPILPTITWNFKY
ncbi:MAG: hypothetical protein ACI9O4_000570 [Chitinophagales bacterium]